jgi:hypothetical protein
MRISEERGYRVLRHVMYWFFVAFFIISTPIVVYYSLGYQFDSGSRRFLKTGMLSIKTAPRGVTVYIDGRKIDNETPCLLREFLPRRYMVELKKERFYAYTIPVDIKSSEVSEIDVTLVPEMRHVQRLQVPWNINKFFVVKYMFGTRTFLFADNGIFIAGDDLKEARLIATYSLDKDSIKAILGIYESGNKIIFWNRANIWLVRLPRLQEYYLDSSSIPLAESVYTAADEIRNVYLGLRDKYVIVHDGMRVVAADVFNKGPAFPVFRLKNMSGEMFYDSDSDTLFIRDKIPPTETFSLFEVKLMELFNEQREDRTHP